MTALEATASHPNRHFFVWLTPPRPVHRPHLKQQAFREEPIAVWIRLPQIDAVGWLLDATAFVSELFHAVALTDVTGFACGTSAAPVSTVISVVVIALRGIFSAAVAVVKREEQDTRLINSRMNLGFLAEWEMKMAASSEIHPPVEPKKLQEGLSLFLSLGQRRLQAS
ncbi:hypothetical protein Cob_v000910 [Colletotrichum orbiculare MAFF 240422]|uniref:Uncharacterized protein n=1 Tax=Colletotrichum orbiculare (strain 104-T / ATCC 96160 / CBS 514.97 / LARS 414 / MAFF 240422) TaxID=1213857 RepID=A0A484G9E0_COLOR|nr:hypothetical protein Cob_v000910 [Colletotrichum orbiculare MAFF 240422]